MNHAAVEPRRFPGLRSILMSACLVMGLASCEDGGTGGGGNDSARVVFVGASITDGWDFDHYFPGQSFAKVILYDPDKTQAWGDVASRHPAIVVVKECAAYFYAEGGTPLADYRGIVAQMVSLIRGIGGTPVLATTIPVDVGSGDCTQAQLDDIHAFNDWIRTYCDSEGIVCMDLAAAISDSNGQLPAACHDGDGLHPNQAGYDLLSPVVLPALQRAGL